MKGEKLMRTQKGITLIALIVTVSVLVILTAVTISTVTNDEIKDKTKNTVSAFEILQEKEKLQNEVMRWDLINNDGIPTLQNYMAGIYGEENVQLNIDNSLTVTVPSGNRYIVTKDGEVTLIDENTPEPEVSNISVSLDKTTITKEIKNGKAVTETITATLNNATGKLTWFSSDPDVAQIATSEGNERIIKLKKEGTATITVAYAENKNIASTCTIDVVEPVNITLDKTTITKEIYSGSTATETIKATLDVEGKTVTWSSSNTSVATVEGNGNTATVTLKAGGTATITASCGNYSATCSVNVTEKEPPALVDKYGNDAQGKVLSTTSNIDVWDKYGNKIVVPAGFKILVDDTTNNADTVIEGIVIEHGTDGNQFVWIPVGTVYTNQSQTTSKKITLGRYVFALPNNDLDGDGTNETAGEIVTGLSVTNPSDKLKSTSTATFGYTEGLKNSTTTNAHARDIEAFIISATTRGGYYLGRYEAGDSSKTAVANRTGTSGKSTAGTLVCKANQVPYNWITQPDASSKCQSMYADGYSSGTFSSDLINSYAWDTAITFIQTFGTENTGDEYYGTSMTYSCSLGRSATSTSEPQKTGTNKLYSVKIVDKQLNVYDMAGNCFEWTTETCEYMNSLGKMTRPCTYRGAYYAGSANERASKRYGLSNYGNTVSKANIAFRPILYVGL